MENNNNSNQPNDDDKIHFTMGSYSFWVRKDALDHQARLFLAADDLLEGAKMLMNSKYASPAAHKLLGRGIDIAEGIVEFRKPK